VSEQVAASPAAPPMNLLQRAIGVIFSPRETYTAVAARPRWFGVLMIALLIMSGAQFALLSTDVGKQLALDQQVGTLETFGQTVSDEQYAQMERGMENARYISPVFTLIFTPLFMALTAGILHVIFGLMGGGNGTYRQVYAISAHSAIISSLQLVFTTIMTIASGRPAGANLGVFVPMLEETTFLVRFLQTIDVFYVWSTLSTAIGLAVLYRRRTGPIAMVLFGIYLVIALIVAFVRSGS
jgi:hypothetical protein